MEKKTPSHRNALKRSFTTTRLESDIRGQILSGKLQPGDPLVSERHLAQLYGISAVSVRKALALLESEGYIEKVWGKGNFVRERTGDVSIAVLVPHLRNPITSDFLHEITLRAKERNCHVLVGNAQNSVDTEKYHIEQFYRRGIRHVLKFPNVLSGEVEVREKLRKCGMRCIILNDFWTDLPGVHVRADERRGMRILLEHLWEKDFHDIAYLDYGFERRERIFEEYREFMRANGGFRKDRVFLSPKTDDFFTDGIDFLREKRGTIDACFHPYVGGAIMFIQCLTAYHGYRIPEDLGVVGFGDTHEAAKPNVSLTTVDMKIPDLVERAFELLFGVRPRGSSIVVEVPPELVVRGSTCGTRNTTLDNEVLEAAREYAGRGNGRKAG